MSALGDEEAGDLQGRCSAGEHEVGGLTLQRAAGRGRQGVADRLADQVVPESEPAVGGLGEQIGPDQLVDRRQDGARRDVEHGRQQTRS